MLPSRQAPRRDNVIPFHSRWRRNAYFRKHRRVRPARPESLLRGVMLVGSLLLAGSFLVEPAVTSAFTPVTPTGCRVVSVTDGDTVRTWCPGRGFERARIMGYDTPEKFSPRCASEYRRAVAASWALRQLLARAETVSFVREGEDRYGRSLIAMWVDGQSVAHRMVADGHARSYDGGRRGGWCS